MIRTRSTYLALLAVLLSPLAAQADLIEVAFTGTGLYIDLDTGQTIHNATLITTYTFDTNDLPLDQHDHNEYRAHHSDNSTNWLSAALEIVGGTTADQSDVDAALGDSYDYNDDVLMIADYLGEGREFLYLKSEGTRSNDWPSVYFRSESYWFHRSSWDDQWGCVEGDTIFGISMFCDTTGVEESFQFFEQWDADGNTMAVATGNNITSVTVNRISVPEPGTLALFGIGLFGIGLVRRRRKA